MADTLLRRLFDFQHFEENARLQAVIDATYARINTRELSDDELDLVSAAGDPEAQKKPRKKGYPGDLST